MNLFEINQAILGTIDTETGEVLDVERLDALQMERRNKLENVACWVKNLEADAEAYKAQKSAFAEREKKAKAKAESLRKWLSDALNGEKLTTTRADMSFRRSEVVEIENETVMRNWAITLHPELLTIKVPEINRTEVKKALKAGMEIPGAVLVERQNLQIK